jgi:hypothetical protein
MRHQAALRLQALHRDGVGDQEDVGLRRARRELGLELGHHVRGALAEPLHLDARMRGGEGVHRLLRVGVGLRGVEHELARHIGLDLDSCHGVS